METSSHHPKNTALIQSLEDKQSTSPLETDVLARARAFSSPLLDSAQLDSGEIVLDHADAVVQILQRMGGSTALQVSSYLVYAFDYLNRPYELIAKGFSVSFADLAIEANKLTRIHRMSQLGESSLTQASNAESIRKLMLAFSQDVRVVLLRLASRLQTLRFHAKNKKQPSTFLAEESLNVYAPLANRLGLWEIKWELEDLAFRFTEPHVYKDIAKLLDEKRIEREAYIEQIKTKLEQGLATLKLTASISGRPKHIYSIVKKMRGKSLSFDQLYDLRAFRILVDSVEDCYRALSWIHEQFTPIESEYDDYIAKPKLNGYQSLHTVVHDAQEKSIEIQIRTHQMHEAAETGNAAHWVYKESGKKGYTGVSATSSYHAKIAILRQLLSWEQDVSAGNGSLSFDDRIYVFTPEARIQDLPKGATAVDFAYSLHTNLGHRCRGARIDGALMSLNTPLKSGQMVEILAAKEGGPSRDWLNPELKFLVSARAKAKVRAWFNAIAIENTIAKGREIVEKLLQREGKTAINLEQLAASQGFADADKLFECVGKDEHSLRNLEIALRPQKELSCTDKLPIRPKNTTKHHSVKDGVLVVGIDSLLTNLAKCCKPLPPESICGFVTRGHGVSVHRSSCVNLRNMVIRSPERMVDVQWGTSKSASKYVVDFWVDSVDRPGLIRDISDALVKDRINVTDAHSQPCKGGLFISLTAQVSGSDCIEAALTKIRAVSGVLSAKRR